MRKLYKMSAVDQVSNRNVSKFPMDDCESQSMVSHKGTTTHALLAE